ncbi:hypothetical protein EU546_00540 [Candidatus Thorarchaeota archaeon]|nr:MAG: hypothetical protein EU546_00540 [Candidatus Thorarchaeota archaeon]
MIKAEEERRACFDMMDLHRRYESALKDTVNEWKRNDEVIGVFAYGSYVKGTATADSDLDVCIVWEGEEAPVRLLSMHREVRIDMLFVTAREVEGVLDCSITEVLTIAGVIGRLRGAKVVHDTKKRLKKWQEKAAEYAWSDTAIQKMKEKALRFLERAQRFADSEDVASAIFEAREGLLRLGRVILMTNNIFHLLKPSEVLSEVRLLDPITYQLFLRAYKLKGMDETKLVKVLTEIKEWLDGAETRLEKAAEEVDAVRATTLLAQAQREYFGALALTYAGDYELAVLEMRQATISLGYALVTLYDSSLSEDASFLMTLRNAETEFYRDILVHHGAYGIQLSEIKRIIGEARFIAQRF